MRGNCYVASEALYHILGGKRSIWRPQVMRTSRTETHWFLRSSLGTVLDPSRRQFRDKLPDYDKARPCPFLTRRPSRRARALMRLLTYQEPRAKR